MAGCSPRQTSNNTTEKYDEILQPLVNYADKDYMTRIFGEPTTKSTEGNLDIWNYHINLADQGNPSSGWYTNTSTQPFKKFHDLTLYFKADTLINWKAEIRE
jgi:hypothetical protein